MDRTGEITTQGEHSAGRHKGFVMLETDVVAAFEILALQAGMLEVVRPSWALSKTGLKEN